MTELEIKEALQSGQSVVLFHEGLEVVQKLGYLWVKIGDNVYRQLGYMEKKRCNVCVCRGSVRFRGVR